MSAEIANALGLVRLAVASAIMLTGFGVVLLGVTGLLRFPDLFTRAHVISTMSGLGGVLLLLGLAIAAWTPAMAVRLLLLGVLLGAAAPAIAHFTAGGAHAAGLAPLSGAYSAPRPGDRRKART